MRFSLPRLAACLAASSLFALSIPAAAQVTLQLKGLRIATPAADVAQRSSEALVIAYVERVRDAISARLTPDFAGLSMQVVFTCRPNGCQPRVTAQGRNNNRQFLRDVENTVRTVPGVPTRGELYFTAAFALPG